MTTPINYTVSQICEITGGTWLSRGRSEVPEYLCLDSRKVSLPSKSVFWAIAGSDRDGSDFISTLYHSGVRNFVTQKPISVKGLKDSNVILVTDAIRALQALAVHHRKKFRKLTVVGTTGSNGKTIVKDWLSEILSTSYRVVKSPRSFNSQIGVALSVLQIRDEHQVAVFEAGISLPGEMRRLEKMIRPHIGIFTNIGTAHDEGFKNRNQKIDEKLQLFKHTKTLVYPQDREISTAIKDKFHEGEIQLLSWCKQHCRLLVSSVTTTEHSSAIRITYARQNYKFTIPFTDKASIENAISVFGGLAACDALHPDTLKSFSLLHPVSMRLELKPGINQCSIINDSYSNDLQSLAVAVDFLGQQSHKHATVILSDLLQSGLTDEELYVQVASILQRKHIRKLIGIGPHISAMASVFDGLYNCRFFPSTEAFLEAAPLLTFHNEGILIKGARKFAFEKISALLEVHLHQTVLSVNLSNLAHNLRVYKKLLRRGTRLMAMVKAFAYGAGSEQIAALLQSVEADYLSVAFPDEGIALRNAGISIPVMVLNTDQSNFDSLIRHQLEPEIFSFGILRDFSDYLATRDIKDYPVHLKIDTGMHRLGFGKNDIDTLLQELQVNRRIKIQSVFSHLSSSDEPAHDAFTLDQFRVFQKTIERLRKVIRYPFLCHIANTSAISRFTELQLDMVRVGIGMYGIDSNPEVRPQLKTVNRLSTTISQIRHVKAGEVVGYGRNRLAQDKTIATVAIGYADGYLRYLGNGRGHMLVHGRPAPTVGNICMDMSMLDITGIPAAREGDEVVVFGEVLPIEKLAKWAKTIPYEILTGISPRVKRIYFEEH